MIKTTVKIAIIRAMTTGLVMQVEVLAMQMFYFVVSNPRQLD